MDDDKHVALPCFDISTRQGNKGQNHITTKGVEHTPFLFELCNALHDGMFVWQFCEPDVFLLHYANPAFCAQANLPSSIFGQTYNKIFNKKPFVSLSHLEKCVKTGKAIKCNCEYDEKTFFVSLYPMIKNNHDGNKQIVHIVGTSTDITEKLRKTQHLECVNKHLVHCEKILRDQIVFEELIGNASRKYMDSGHSGFAVCTEDFITRLKDLLRVDWACVWEHNDGACITSSKTNIASNDLFETNLVFEDKGCIKQFRSGKMVVINDLETETSHLFPELINKAKKKGLRSIVIVPILRDDDFFGVIVAAQLNMKRTWTTIDISRLKTAADTIMSAYLRIKMEQHLNESNRVLAEYDECLQDILNIQESLSEVSNQYTNADSHQFASCTNHMLEVLATLTAADYTYIYDFDNKSFIAYEWCKRGFVSINNKSKNVVPASIWTELLKNNERFTASNVPEEQTCIPSVLSDKMQSLGIKSLLAVPIRNDRTFFGVMVVCKVLGCHDWNNLHYLAAKQSAEVFLGNYLRICREQQLVYENQTHMSFASEAAKRTEMMQIVAKSAQLFFDATAENLMDVFSTITKEISEPLQIQSVILTRYSDDFTKARIVFDWASYGRLPKRADSIYNHHGNTAVIIPVVYQKAVWGSLHVCFSSKKPNDNNIDILDLAAQYFAGAYMKIYSGKSNCSSEKHFLTSLKSQPAVI